jgi:hypothetical protein
MDPYKLYSELNRIMSSTHNDTPAEQADAIEILRQEMILGTKPEVFIEKMKAMKSATDQRGDYLSKLSTVIKNRFWEKSFTTAIPFRAFRLQ